MGIPEWKRGALVVNDQAEEEAEELGRFGRFKGKLQEKIDSTEAAQKFYESEDYQKLKEVRGEVKNFKAELKDQVDGSQNPAVNLVSQGVDKVFSETGQALAVKEMKKYDPEFDLEELLYEAEEIFQEFYCNYLTGNDEYLKLICGSTAGAQIQALIEGRKKEGWQYKYDEVLTCGPTFFMGAKIQEKIPTFTFTVEV